VRLALLLHAGHRHLGTAEILGWWSWEPLVVLALVVAAVAYARGVRTLWARAGRGSGLRRVEVAAYACGLVALALALVSPLDRLGAVLFSAHMAQHEMLMLVAAPLLVVGRPVIAWLWALPPAARARAAEWSRQDSVRRPWRFLTGPVVALVLHGLTRWVWHVPALFEAAMRSAAVHAVQHTTFFWTAALFWYALIHGRYGRMGYGVAALFAWVTAMHTGVLAALITFASRPLYALYEQRGAPYDVGVVEDQQLAGLIMWVPSGAVLMVIGLALFAAWIGESERRVAFTRADTLSALGEDAHGA
jgi:putative membrane protein